MALSRRRVSLDKQSQDERLTAKHVRTLAYTQSLVDDNERLRRRVATLENDMQGREEVYRIGVECQMKMQELEEKCVEKVSSVVDSLTEEHKQEMTDLLWGKLETEKRSQNEIGQLLERLHKLETSYFQLKETCMSGENVHRENNKTLKELRCQLSDAHTAANNMRSANQNLATLNKQLEEQLNSLSNETATERQEFNQMKKQFAEVQTERRKLQKENRDLSESLNNSRKDLKRMRQELQTIAGQHSSCATTIRQLQDALVEKERQLNTKGLSPHKLEIKIQQLEERCSGLSGELEQAVKRGEVTQAAKSDLEYLVKSLDAKNDSIADQLEECHSERILLLANVDKLTCEVSELKSRLKLHGGRSQDFVEYVKLKREVLVLRDQNEQLMKQRSRSCDRSSPDCFRLLGRPLQKRASFSRVLSVAPSQHSMVERSPTPGGSRKQ